ncbi:MAG: F0F1 ATP synthase subunit epsilon [Candidatus Omnitrophica bacterium]|nr:F0F1 ATP synthase subunit epsilon [Candidatus Omnitrophota bacterium]
MKTYLFSLITPKGKIFEAEISSLVAPGKEGFFGVLNGHAPFIAQIKPGVLKVNMDEKNEKFFNVQSGVFEFNSENRALMLCDDAAGVEG